MQKYEYKVVKIHMKGIFKRDIDPDLINVFRWVKTRVKTRKLGTAGLLKKSLDSGIYIISCGG